MSDEKAKQTETEYKPKPCELVLVEYMLDPNNRFKSVTDICKELEITRAKYYRMFKKPKFVQFYKEQCKSLVEKHVGQVVTAFVREAQRGSFQHGKVLLEMSQLYSEKSGGIDISNNGDGGTLTIIIGGEKVDADKLTKKEGE